MTHNATIPEAALDVTESAGARRQVSITETPFLIGRGGEGGNHLQVADKRVSRRAAAIVYEDGRFRVEDRGQRNGVLVNGQEVQVQDLRDGDVITLGTADTLQLVFHTGPTRESLPTLLSRLEQAAALEPGARDLRPLGLLLEATTLLQSHLPLEELLGEMVDRAMAVTDADRGVLLEADPEGGWRPLVARLRGGARVPPDRVVPSQTAVQEASRKRRSVVEEDTALGKLAAATSVVQQQLRSVVAVPLQSLAPVRASDQTMLSIPGTLLGVLYLDSRRPAAFSRLERQILDALAREAASVLDNARLLQKEQERKRMEQELDIARNIQQGLLPRDLGRFRHAEIAGINRSCLAVGGDYFDVMEIARDRSAFVIADVCGKGLGAALLTAMLQGSFTAMTMGSEPAGVFEHINRFIFSHTEADRYATLFFGFLNASGHMEYINAGHHSPLLLRQGKVTNPCPAESLPVGLLPDAAYISCSVALEPGDTLVLYTDGITEAANTADELYGHERLEAVAARHAEAPLEELQAAILADVEEFSRGTYQADDITLLILRFHGEGTTQG